ITRRLISSSLAGTSRKLVAVGTSREATMLAAMRAAAPRSGWPTGALGAAGAAAAGAATCGGVVALAGAAVDGAPGAAGGRARGRGGGGGRGRHHGRCAVAGAVPRRRGGGRRWGRRGARGGGRGRRRPVQAGRIGLVVREEVPPAGRHRLGVAEIALVHLVDQPGIRTKRLLVGSLVSHVGQ